MELSERKVLLFVGDAVALALSLGLLALRDSSVPYNLQPVWYAILVAVWLVVATAADGYDLGTAARWHASVARAARAALVTVVLYLATSAVWAPLRASLSSALAFSLGAVCLLVGWRAAYAWLVSRQWLQARVLVIGTGGTGEAIVGAMRELGGVYRVVGVVDPDPESWGSTMAGVPVAGSVADLGRLVDDRHVDEVVLADADGLQDECQAALLDAAERGVRISRAADLFEPIARRVLVSRSSSGWLDVLPRGATSGALHSLYRRAFDLAFAIPGIVALGLILPLVALAIRLDSPGPIFYSQERVGKRGKVFKIAKFRSMREDAEPSGQAIWACPDDRRITRVGRILRKTRIDELPQFLSILKGDMSLIGPRPERPVFVDVLERQIPFYRIRHLVKPGLTGWAQVNYRYGSTVDDARVKLEYDLYYIKHESPLLDLLTILKTIGIVVRCKGT